MSKASQIRREDVIFIYERLYVWGMISQMYFLIVVSRDLLIFCVHLSSNSLVGFWNALWMHMVSISLDFIFFIAICIQSYQVLSDELTLECERDFKCNEFVKIFRTNITAGFIYIFFNVSFKLLMIVFFMCCFGGYEMLNDDF